MIIGFKKLPGMIEKINKTGIIYLLIFISIFYFIFPTNNSSLDAYAYAGYIDSGESLFAPHHLLYNVFLFSIIHPVKLVVHNLDILLISKYINSFFLVLNLLIFYLILSKLSLVKKEKIIFTLIVGFSFSLWRYGTENETYIIPIAFSLLASLQFLNYLNTNKLRHVFFSSVFASIACLFHQIHFFWWLGLLFGVLYNRQKFKAVALYSATALLVPLVYILVLIYYENQVLSFHNLTHFVFHDFYMGSARSEFGWENFFFTAVSSFRTFFQFHPNIWFLIQRSFVYSIPIVLSLYFFYTLLKFLKRKELIMMRSNFVSGFAKTHLLIFILQFLFAFYSAGNVEFMVMIPFLLFLSFFLIYKINLHILSLLSLTLFVWNFSYGIYPNHRFNYYNDEVLVDFIIKHPDDIFIVKNADVLNRYYYKTGIDNYKNIVLYHKIHSAAELEELFEQNNAIIYTDIIDKPAIFDRSEIVSSDYYKLDFKEYNKEYTFRYDGFYGTSFIYKIQQRSN